MIVLWRITTRCNLACPFCAYDRRLPFPRVDADPAAIEDFAQLLGAYRLKTGERVLLSWLGGEPLLWPPLLVLSRRLRLAHGLSISATSNGTLLHRQAVRAGILDAFDELTFSIDGLADFHDPLRGWAGGFARLQSGIGALLRERAASGAGLKLRANLVLMRANLAQLEALCTLLADWGVDEITFNQLGGRDRPEFFPAHALRPHDVAMLQALLPDLRRRLADRNVRLCADDLYLRRIAASVAGEAWPVADCRPGEPLLFVDEAGHVSPCSFTTHAYGVPLAQLRCVQDLIDLPQKFHARRRQAAATACSDCPSTRVFAKFAG